MAEAADLVADGVVDVAIAGGVDALTRMCFMGFNALKLLDPEPCRPFDRDRRGMSIGEGAAFLVLEAAEHARARAARGSTPSSADYGVTTDAHPRDRAATGRRRHDPRDAGRALDAAGCRATAVGYVNAHGTATPQNDRIEAQALARSVRRGRRAASARPSR